MAVEASAFEHGMGGGPLPVKIPIDREGIWSLTHADLLAAGFDATGTSSTALSLTAGGAASRPGPTTSEVVPAAAALAIPGGAGR